MVAGWLPKAHTLLRDLFVVRYSCDGRRPSAKERHERELARNYPASRVMLCVLCCVPRGRAKLFSRFWVAHSASGAVQTFVALLPASMASCGPTKPPAAARRASMPRRSRPSRRAAPLRRL